MNLCLKDIFPHIRSGVQLQVERITLFTTIPRSFIQKTQIFLRYHIARVHEVVLYQVLINPVVLSNHIVVNKVFLKALDYNKTFF